MVDKHSAAALRKALRKCERDLLKLDGVVGVAIRDVGGRPGIAVYVVRATEALRAAIPELCDGYQVVVEVSGPLRAL